MKAISLVNIFTLVCFLVVGEAGVAAPDPVGQSKEECISEKYNSIFEANCTKEMSATDKSSCESSAQREAEKYIKCKGLPTESELKDDTKECSKYMATYTDKMTKASTECNRMNVSSIQQCETQAASCSRGDSLSAISSGTDTMMNALSSMTSLFGGAGACTIENDDAGRTEKGKLEKEISSFREKITKEKEKMVKARQERAKAQKKTADEHQKAVDAYNKALATSQTQASADALKVRKDNIDLDTARRKNLMLISEQEVIVSNKALEAMEININFSEDLIKSKCYADAEKLRGVKLQIDPKTGKPKSAVPAADAARINKELQVEYSKCLKMQNLTAQATAKKNMDEVRMAQRKIEEYKNQNADAAKMVAANNIKISEDTTIRTKADTDAKNALDAAIKAMEEQTKEMEVAAAEEKQNIDLAIFGYNQDILRIQAEIANLKPKFQKVSSTLNEGKEAARTYQQYCCSPSQKIVTTKDRIQKEGCDRIAATLPEMEYEEPGSLGGSSGTQW